MQGSPSQESPTPRLTRRLDGHSFSRRFDQQHLPRVFATTKNSYPSLLIFYYFLVFFARFFFRLFKLLYIPFSNSKNFLNSAFYTLISFEFRFPCASRKEENCNESTVFRKRPDACYNYAEVSFRMTC